MLCFSIFRKKPLVFKVKIGGPETTDEIARYLEDKGYDFVNGNITQKNFPLKSRKTLEERKIVIHAPGGPFTKDEGFAILKSIGLLPPTYEDALRFARQHRKVIFSSKKRTIAFLHEPWRDETNNLRIICLDRSMGDVSLDLHYINGWEDGGIYRFDDNYVLAGVLP